MGEMTIEDYKESIDIIMKDRDKRVLNERKLQSENKRLRDALQEIINFNESEHVNVNTQSSKIARQALKEGE